MALDRPVPAVSAEPVPVGELFRLRRTRCGHPLEAICSLLTHPLGWELRLEVGGSVQRAEVCRSQDTALDTSVRWKAGMMETGWS